MVALGLAAEGEVAAIPGDATTTNPPRTDDKMAVTKQFDQIAILRTGNLAALLGCAVLLVSFVAWSWASYGFYTGHSIAEREYRSQPATLAFSGGLNSYADLADEYYFLVWIVAGVLGVCATRRLLDVTNTFNIFGSVLNIFLLLVMWTRLRFLFGLKDPAMNVHLDAPFNTLVRESVFYDWMGIVIVSTLLAIEAVLLVKTMAMRRSEASSGVVLDEK